VSAFPNHGFPGTGAPFGADLNLMEAVDAIRDVAVAGGYAQRVRDVFPLVHCAVSMRDSM